MWNGAKEVVLEPSFVRREFSSIFPFDPLAYAKKYPYFSKSCTSHQADQALLINNVCLYVISLLLNFPSLHLSHLKLHMPK